MPLGRCTATARFASPVKLHGIGADEDRGVLLVPAPGGRSHGLGDRRRIYGADLKSWTHLEANYGRLPLGPPGCPFSGPRPPAAGGHRPPRDLRQSWAEAYQELAGSAGHWFGPSNQPRSQGDFSTGTSACPPRRKGSKSTTGTYSSGMRSARRDGAIFGGTVIR